MSEHNQRRAEETLREIRDLLVLGQRSVSVAHAKIEKYFQGETPDGACSHPKAVNVSTGGGGPRRYLCPDCNANFVIEEGED